MHLWWCKRQSVKALSMLNNIYWFRKTNVSLRIRLRCRTQKRTSIAFGWNTLTKHQELFLWLLSYCRWEHKVVQMNFCCSDCWPKSQFWKPSISMPSPHLWLPPISQHTQHTQFLLRVVSSLEGEPMVLVFAEPGGAPWAKATWCWPTSASPSSDSRVVTSNPVTHVLLKEMWLLDFPSRSPRTNLLWETQQGADAPTNIAPGTIWVLKPPSHGKVAIQELFYKYPFYLSLSCHCIASGNHCTVTSGPQYLFAVRSLKTVPKV